MRLITLLLAALTLAVAAPAIAGKGGNPNGGVGNGNGGGNGNAGGRDPATGTLTATPNPVQAGGHFDLNGSGFDTTLGNVMVGYGGGGWGSPLDASGNFTIPDIPVGDGASPGTYPVTAYQYVNGKWTVTAQTSVTVE